MTLRDEYESGDSLMTIAVRHGIDPSTVRARVLAAGGVMRKPWATRGESAHAGRIRALARMGVPRRQIAQRLSVSGSTIVSVLGRMR